MSMKDLSESEPPVAGEGETEVKTMSRCSLSGNQGVGPHASGPLCSSTTFRGTLCSSAAIIMCVSAAANTIFCVFSCNSNIGKYGRSARAAFQPVF